MNKIVRVPLTSFFSIFILMLMLWTPNASAFEEYAGGCEGCHGGFRSSPYISLADGISWGDDLHDVHRINMLGGDCNVCHSTGGRSPVFLNFSTGGAGLDPISCSGCHGRAEPSAGGQVTGAGLRQHHWNSGVQTCSNCHSDADPAQFTVAGENVQPPYYFTPDASHPNKPTDSCNPLGEEHYAGSTIGLDNDGDGLYDQADPDCAALQPPVADANGPYNAVAGNTITFDGSGSSDSDGTITVYAWDFGDGVGVGAGVNPTYAYSLAGTYTVTLTVTDNDSQTDTATTTATITAANVAPTADPNGPYTGTAGLPVSLDGLGSSDSDGTIVSYAWDFGDGSGGAGVSPSHTYAAAGTYAVTLTVTDNDGATDTASTTATIAPVPNVAPTADPNGPYTGSEGVPVLFDGSGSSDADGTITSYAWDFGDGSGGAGVSPSHTYAAAGSYTVSLTVTDNDGATDTATTTTDIAAVNDAPVAVDDAYATDEDTSLNVAAPGVLGNDSDADGDALTAVLNTAPGNGSLTLNADGSFSYTPNANFNGPDSFTYHANDGQADSNIATVSITVNDVNDAPVANDDASATPFETPVTIDVLANDVDVDGDSLTVNSFDATSVNGAAVSCTTTCTYTPMAGFSGDDSFTYDATDGALVSNVVTVTVTVNAAAVIDLDISQFKVTKRVRLANPKPIAISLVVKNNGVVNSQSRPATVSGIQGGVVVYNDTQMVHDSVGNGRTQFRFPAFTPVGAGDISWTVTIADDDPDIDEAIAVTTVQ